MNTSARSGQGGFSLLEVIAAILLLAIAFGSLMRVAGSSINLTGHAAARSRMAMVARSLLDSAGQLEPLRLGSTEGSYDEYHWRLTVSSWENGEFNNPSMILYKLDLQLWPSGESRRRGAHFATVRALGATAGGGP